MPKASLLFNDMTTRVKKLKGKYMARQIRGENLNPIGYKFDELNAAAYRLLVHAEFEEYIEAKASTKLSEIKADVLQNGYGTSFLKNILAISHKLDSPLIIGVPYDESDFKKKVLDLIKEAEKEVTRNNGIKEGSFLKLALFAGYDLASIDPVLLKSIDGYGVRRGSVAHRGPRHAKNFLSPSSEVSDAETIISHLRMHYYGF